MTKNTGVLYPFIKVTTSNGGTYDLSEAYFNQHFSQ